MISTTHHGCGFRGATNQVWKIYSPRDAFDMEYIVPVADISPGGDVNQWLDRREPHDEYVVSVFLTYVVSASQISVEDHHCKIFANVHGVQQISVIRPSDTI